MVAEGKNVHVEGDVDSQIVTGDCNVLNTGSGNQIVEQLSTAEAVRENERIEREKARIPHALPVPAPEEDFTGRAQEVSDVKVVLTGGRRAAISGMGGVGKSELAFTIARDLNSEDRFPHGMFYLHLLGTTKQPLEPRKAMERVIRAIEPRVDLPDDEGQVSNAYQGILADKRMLLLLDDARDEAQVRRLLPPSTVTLIVTSRQRIVLDGGVDFRLDQMTSHDARALLMAIVPVERAGEGELDQLAQACGYLPLALRVAGRFLKIKQAWNVERYLSELSDVRTRLPNLRDPNDPSRDVAAALEVSVRQLEADNPTVAARWRMLAVFPFDFHFAAAQFVWQEAKESTAADVIDELTNRSLLLQKAGRYRLHDLMRDVALAEHQDSNGTHDFQIRHRSLFNKAKLLYFDCFLIILGTHNKEFANSREHQLISLLNFEIDFQNFIYILQKSLEDYNKNKNKFMPYKIKSAIFFVNYVLAGSHLFIHQLPLSYLLEIFKQGLDASKQISYKNGEAMCKYNLAHCQIRLGQLREGIAALEKILEYIKQEPINIKDVYVYYELGVAYERLENYEKAVDNQLNVRCIALKDKDRNLLKMATGALGTAYLYRGDIDISINFLNRSLFWAEKLKDVRESKSAHENLANALREKGDSFLQRSGEPTSKYDKEVVSNYHEKSLYHYDRAGLIANQLKDRVSIGNCFHGAALIFWKRGQLKKAESYLQNAIDNFCSAGVPLEIAQGLFTLAALLWEQGIKSDAKVKMRKAAEIYESINHPRTEIARAKLTEWEAEEA